MTRWLANLSLKTPPADARLLPEGRMAGPMPWVIAIMMFLTVLAAAAGLSLGASAAQMDADMAGRYTIQLVDGGNERRAAELRAIKAELGRLAGVGTYREVPPQEVATLLEPWFGSDGLDPDLPMPNLVDVVLKRTTAADIAALGDSVRAIAPTARIDAHAAWLAPLSGLIAALKWLSLGLVGMMAAATMAVVVLAAKSALNTHRATIEVMHLLGANDLQIARLFQRRIALDSLLGGAIGLVLGLVVLGVIGLRLSAIGSDMLAAGPGALGWLMIVLLPLIGAALSTIAARTTVLGALKGML